MSLIDNYKEEFVFMNKAKVSDGEGGFSVDWAEGAAFEAALTLDSSLAARVAEAEGVSNLYTVTVEKDIALEFHDVIKRQSDGAYFRITSDGTDKHTPNAATLNMRQASAEKWMLTA